MAKPAPSASSAFTESVWQGALLKAMRPAHLPPSTKNGARLRTPGPDQTGLHIVDGKLQRSELPPVAGHEIIGNFAAGAASSRRLRAGRRAAAGRSQRKSRKIDAGAHRQKPVRINPNFGDRHFI